MARSRRRPDKPSAKQKAKGQYLALCAWLRQRGIHEAPVREWEFHHQRRWRLDYAWPYHLVAVEVNGGLFLPQHGKAAGRHIQGPALRDEYEKLNEARLDGWTVLLVTPDQLMTERTFRCIQRALREARERLYVYETFARLTRQEERLQESLDRVRAETTRRLLVAPEYYQGIPYG